MVRCPSPCGHNTTLLANNYSPTTQLSSLLARTDRPRPLNPSHGCSCYYYEEEEQETHVHGLRLLLLLYEKKKKMMVMPRSD